MYLCHLQKLKYIDILFCFRLVGFSDILSVFRKWNYSSRLGFGAVLWFLTQNHKTNLLMMGKKSFWFNVCVDSIHASHTSISMWKWVVRNRFANKTKLLEKPPNTFFLILVLLWKWPVHVVLSNVFLAKLRLKIVSVRKKPQNFNSPSL